jgi:transcriptional regulator with XRE-family HTH domain
VVVRKGSSRKHSASSDSLARHESESLGQWLRRLRLHHFAGLTIAQFAKQRLQISGPYLTMIETGKAIPSIDVLLRTASVLHLDKEELLKLAGYTEPELLKQAQAKSPPESSSYIEAMRTIARNYNYGYTFTVRDFVSVILGRYLRDSMKTEKVELLSFVELVAEVVSKPRRFISEDLRICAQVGGKALKILVEVKAAGRMLEVGNVPEAPRQNESPEPSFLT